MPNRVNTMMLEEYEKRFRDAEYMIAVGFDGLGGHATFDLRTRLTAQSMRMEVVKNRIVRRAFEKNGISGVEKILNGGIAFVIGSDPVAMARMLKDFAKENKALVVRGAVIEKEVLGEAAAQGLADMASREELQGRIVSAALSGGANIAGALRGPGSVIAGCLKSMIEKQEKESA